MEGVLVKRRMFLTKGTAGVLALGAFGCSENNSVNPVSTNPTDVPVTGLIAGPEGNGIQGIALTITGKSVVKTVVTDAAGRFTSSVPGNGVYSLSPKKTGYSFNPAVQKITVNNERSFVVNIMAVMVNTASGGIGMTELGTTGIMVSRFGFGSHVYEDNTGPMREYMIHEAYDRGVRVFDIYNTDQGGYQYEDLGRYLSGVKQDTALSIYMESLGGKTLEKKLDDDLKLLGRECIDMFRIQAWSSTDTNKNSGNWPYWEEAFRLRDAGKIRAVGVPIHEMADLDELMTTYIDDLDYVFFPYNFYHNIGWPPDLHPEFPTLAQDLRARGIGVVTIKPFAGDYFITALKNAARDINPDLSFTQAALRYVINSGLEPDTTFCGMNQFSEFLENVKAYEDPEISGDEQALLDEVRVVAEKTAQAVLPDYYRFLDTWAPGGMARQHVRTT